jgi:hypothetical protein
LHQVGDLFELNVKLRCQKVKRGTKVKRSIHTTFQFQHRIQLFRQYDGAKY